MSLVSTVITIASGQPLSGEANLGNRLLVGIAMPAAWTAAALTFQVSPDGGTTWLELYTSAGTEQAFTVAAGQFIAVDPTLWRGANAVKLRSGTAASPVNQGQNATLALITI